MVQFNGDLLDRITEVPVEPWDHADLLRVIQKGEELLNVDFSNVRNQVVNESFNSVGVVQEICKLCCLEAPLNCDTLNKICITNEHLEVAKKIKQRNTA